MKVIGTSGSGVYIVEIDHDEIEKVVDKYYGNLSKLVVGQTFNLAQGYDFRTDIQRTCKSMQDAMQDFERSRVTLHRFALMVAQQDSTGSAA